jgi:hypothetical protein
MSVKYVSNARINHARGETAAVQAAAMASRFVFLLAIIKG